MGRKQRPFPADRQREVSRPDRQQQRRWGNYETAALVRGVPSLRSPTGARAELRRHEASKPFLNSHLTDRAHSVDSRDFRI